MNRSMSRKLKEFIYEKGASLVGFADLNMLPSQIRYGMDFGISIAIALNPNIVEKINIGPTIEYQQEYWEINKELDKLSSNVTEYILKEGYSAISFNATTGKYNPKIKQFDTKLPHKTVATIAGLGFIGKCALLINKKYGSAIRITTVLTNFPLIPDKPIDRSLCGNCSLCVDGCPANAFNGREWTLGLYRDKFFNPSKCDKVKKEILIEKGLKQEICGICIAVCPWTQNYIKNSKKLM